MNTTYEALGKLYESESNRWFYEPLALELIHPEDHALRGRALDLACGTGYSTASLCRTLPDLQWSALDASSQMLKRAKAKSIRPAVEWVNGSAEDLPYESDQFIFVACSFGFHWFEESALGEIRRVLAPSGILSMTVPVTGSHSEASGNLFLKKELLRLRTKRTHKQSAGYCPSQLVSRFNSWAEIKTKMVNRVELFQSPGDLAQALYSRGSLHAVFGTLAQEVLKNWAKLPAQRLSLNWNYVRVRARKPIL